MSKRQNFMALLISYILSAGPFFFSARLSAPWMWGDDADALTKYVLTYFCSCGYRYL